jgi:hypothetical protein
LTGLRTGEVLRRLDEEGLAAGGKIDALDVARVLRRGAAEGPGGKGAAGGSTSGRNVTQRRTPSRGRLRTSSTAGPSSPRLLDSGLGLVAENKTPAVKLPRPEELQR